MAYSLFTTAYFPPIIYLSKMLEADKICIEAHENFQKQSYRNRCHIYGANGKQTLSVPIKKGPDLKTGIQQVEIDYTEEWQKNHWKSIESAYRSSPYFEYYIDDFRFVFEEETQHLIHLNQRILDTILQALELELKVSFTSEFTKPGQPDIDYRYSIHPKKDWKTKEPGFNDARYNQVFIDKHGFLPNLSIIDLLFNEGPNAISFL